MESSATSDAINRLSSQIAEFPERRRVGRTTDSLPRLRAAYHSGAQRRFYDLPMQEQSKNHLLHLIQTHHVAPPVIELGCPRALVRRHLLRLVEIPTLGQVDGNPGRPEGVAPDFGFEGRCYCQICSLSHTSMDFFNHCGASRRRVNIPCKFLCLSIQISCYSR
jgi:hypothetical protein